MLAPPRAGPSPRPPLPTGCHSPLLGWPPWTPNSGARAWPGTSANGPRRPVPPGACQCQPQAWRALRQRFSRAGVHGQQRRQRERLVRRQAHADHHVINSGRPVCRPFPPSPSLASEDFDPPHVRHTGRWPAGGSKRQTTSDRGNAVLRVGREHPSLFPQLGREAFTPLCYPRVSAMSGVCEYPSPRRLRCD